MTYVPCSERTFLMKLAPDFLSSYSRQAFWLRHLVERLGRGPAQRVWSRLYQAQGDDLLDSILERGWVSEDGEPINVEARAEAIARDLFNPPVGGMSAAEARQLLDGSLPHRAILDRFEDLNLVRPSTAYERLHLFLKPLALLAEALIDLHGKQGELVAYDAMLYRLASDPPEPISARTLLNQFTIPPDQPSVFTAGIEYDLVRANDTEVVIAIKECEWARYFREHHPKVGYLVACSMDEASNRALNPRIRLQRTMTIMEGSPLCDFRFYALPGANDD
jgi:hypothetical protein